jgi:fused signal recognition particle receptor
VCCPQINREGNNNNNNCWQSVSSVVGGVNVRCSTSSSDRRVGFLGRLGRVFKEKAKSDIQLLFSGFSKTRENLAVVDELLTYWNLSDSENILDELEEVLLVSDFGPRTAMKIVDGLRKDILKGTLKSGPDIKVALKRIIVRLLTENVSSTELQLGQSRPAVIMIVGVNGGGKTTTIGKLAHRFKNENVKVPPHVLSFHLKWNFSLVLSCLGFLWQFTMQLSAVV